MWKTTGFTTTESIFHEQFLLVLYGDTRELMLIFRFIVRYVGGELRSGMVTQEPLLWTRPASYYQKMNVMESATFQPCLGLPSRELWTQNTSLFVAQNLLGLLFCRSAQTSPHADKMISYFITALGIQKASEYMRWHRCQEKEMPGSFSVRGVGREEENACGM